MADAEEAGFVRAAQRGDRVAFIALARYYWPSVARVVEALAGSPEAAARRTLDVFEHAWKGLHFVPDGQRFYVWLHRIAFNLCQAGPVRVETAARGLPAEDPAHRCELAFGHLSAEHQQVLVLRLASHLGVEDVARVLELTPAAAKERLSQARADLHLRWSGLRHFNLQQLSDYVGTEPASAPEFVRAHLGECTDCRRALTALEAQERILTILLASAADSAGLERFLDEVVERIAGERPGDRVAAAAKPGIASALTASLTARAPEPPRGVSTAIRPLEPAPEPGSPPARSAASPPWVVAGVLLVLFALLGVQFGSRIEPWLLRHGIRWGGPEPNPPPTVVASVKRFTPEPIPDSLGAEEAGVLPAPEATASGPPIPNRPSPAASPRKGESGVGGKHGSPPPERKPALTASAVAPPVASRSKTGPARSPATGGTDSTRGPGTRTASAPAAPASAPPEPPPRARAWCAARSMTLMAGRWKVRRSRCPASTWWW